jgi:ferredoxin
VQSTDEERVEVIIDPDVCVGIGACVAAEPEAFIFNEDGSSRVVPGCRLPRHRAEQVRVGCPSGAIAIAENLR